MHLIFISAVYTLGAQLGFGFDSSSDYFGGDEEYDDDAKVRA